MIKGWWAGKTKARLVAKASGAIGKLSKEIRSAIQLVASLKLRRVGIYMMYFFDKKSHAMFIANRIVTQCRKIKG